MQTWLYIQEAVRGDIVLTQNNVADVINSGESHMFENDGFRMRSTKMSYQQKKVAASYLYSKHEALPYCLHTVPLRLLNSITRKFISLHVCHDTGKWCTLHRHTEQYSFEHPFAKMTKVHCHWQ